MRELTVVEIYETFKSSFEFYRQSKTTWKNSIRHVLTVNQYFVMHLRIE